MRLIISMIFPQSQIVRIILYHNGIVYTEFLGIRVGGDAEANRHVFQNEIVHDPQGIPRFKITNKKDAFYFVVRFTPLSIRVTKQ